MASRMEIAERLAEECDNLMLKSGHSCDQGPCEGEERLIIHYVAACRKCLAEFLSYVLKRKTPLA